jgi:2',3'-cyclic-nucleotide 2'-phosphodiesterase (5'-nucleotidase family)
MFSSTVLLSGLFLLGVSADEVQRREQGSTTTISFIHINDHHSHFDEQSFDLFEANIPPGLSVETGTLRAYYGTYQLLLFWILLARFGDI